MKLVFPLIFFTIALSCSESPTLVTGSGDNDTGKPLSTDPLAGCDLITDQKAARVGGEKLLAAIDKCNLGGYYFDRKEVAQINEASAEQRDFELGCTSKVLACIKCDREGILAHTRKKGEEELAKKLEQGFDSAEKEDLLIDQCFVCPKGDTTEDCTKSENEFIVIKFIDKISSKFSSASTVK